MKSTVLIIIALLASGLAQAQHQPNEPFVWEGKVRVVVDTPSQTRRNCDSYSSGRTVDGCYRKDGDVHVIYSSFRHSHSSRRAYHETIGHELEHGIEGNFHSKDDK